MDLETFSVSPFDQGMAAPVGADLDDLLGYSLSPNTFAFAEPSTSNVLIDDYTSLLLPSTSSVSTPFIPSSRFPSNSTPVQIPKSTKPSKGASRVKSCAACRIRRVKCERDAGVAECKKCLEKGLHCTAMPKVTRAGRTKKEAPAPSSVALPDASNKKVRRESEGSATFGELSPYSATSTLASTELEGVLSASLVDLYLKLPQGRVSLMEDGSNFRGTFQAANRRITELDPHNQVLLAIVLAVTARVSDHPLLVGASPSMRQLDEMIRTGQDLSPWGRRRESACEALAQKAIQLADEAAVWREASITNIVILVLLEGLTGQLGTSSRPYGDAYMSHLRELLESDDSKATAKETLLTSGLGWLCWLRDGSHSAWAGRKSSFEKEDIELLLVGASERQFRPLRNALESGPLLNWEKEVGKPWMHPFGAAMGSLMMHLRDLHCEFTPQVTGIGALRRPIKIESIQDLMERLELGLAGSLFLEQLAIKHFGVVGECSKKGEAYWNIVRTLRINRSGLSIRLNRFLKSRVETPAISRLPEDLLNWDRIEALQKSAEVAAFAACREIILMIRRNLDTGISFSVVSGAQFLFSRLQPWISVLLETPTEEEGGRASFTFTEKLNDLEAVLQALRGVGWSYERLARPSAWIEQEIAEVKSRQASYRQRLAEAEIVGSGGGPHSDILLTEKEVMGLVGEIEASLNAAGDAILPQNVGVSSGKGGERDVVIVRMLGYLLG